MSHAAAEPAPLAGGVVVGRIVIVRTVLAEDIVDQVVAIDANGDDLVLSDCLSMLGLAEHTLVDERMHGADDG